MSHPLWITESDVVSVLDMDSAIAALRTVLHLEARGGAFNLKKTVVSWGDGDTLHAIGAAVPGANLVGTKTWAHTSGGASPLLVLWNSEDGALEAVVEAFALGQFRTAAVSAIATDVLARPNADVFCIVGSGKQALPQVAAVAAVRAIRQLRVFSPTAAHRERFAAVLREHFDFEIVESKDVEGAVHGADIVTLATRATTPFLRAAAPSSGAHINAMGAIVPERVEFDPRMLDRCAVVAADSVEQAQTLSREFRIAFGDDGWQRVQPLSHLVAEGARRPDGADLTLFKAMGMGISDVALGQSILNSVRLRGLGRPFAPPRRVPILSPTPMTAGRVS